MKYRSCQANLIFMHLQVWLIEVYCFDVLDFSLKYLISVAYGILIKKLE